MFLPHFRIIDSNRAKGLDLISQQTPRRVLHEGVAPKGCQKLVSCIEFSGVLGDETIGKRN